MARDHWILARKAAAIDRADSSNSSDAGQSLEAIVGLHRDLDLAPSWSCCLILSWNYNFFHLINLYTR
ncbi:hypothetical protein FOVSG1_010601 [Fusarium oxysporum f. sp. vasinfectum]